MHQRPNTFIELDRPRPYAMSGDNKDSEYRVAEWPGEEEQDAFESKNKK